MRIAGIALLLLAAAIAAWYGPGTPLGAVIFALHPPFLNTLQAGVQRNLSPELWNGILLPVLEGPAWLGPAVVGAPLLAVSVWRRRRG